MGTGFTYTINMLMLGDNGLSRLLGLLDRLDAGVDRIGTSVDTLATRIEGMSRRGGSSVDSLTGKVKGMIATVGGAALVWGSLQGAANMDSATRSINFASGGAEAGAKNIAFVRDTVDSLGLPLKESLQGFKTLEGGLMGTGVTMKQTQDLFMAMGQGAAVMGMSADDTQGAFMALSQMASKGKVSAEELRGQLGERLPGAFNIAARSMGVSTSELDKMLEKGQVMAKDFLPKFAAEMTKTFGPGVADASTSATANFNRFHNSVLDLQVSFGQYLLPTVLTFMNGYIIPAIKWLGEHINLIGMVAAAIGGAVVAYKAWQAGIWMVGVWTKIAALETLTFQGVMGALNLTMMANPIGLLVMAIGALVAAVVYAWNHFEGFRATMYGVWEVIKPFGVMLWDALTWPLQMVNLAVEKVWGSWSGFADWLKGIGATIKQFGQWIWDNLIHPFTVFGKIYDYVKPLLSKIGGSVSETFDKGFQKGLDSMKADAAAEAAAKQPSALDALNKYGAGAVSGQPTAPGGGAGGGGAKATKGIEAVTSGGAKTINITVGKYMDTLTVNVASAAEGADAIADMILRKLTQTINSANQVQTQ